MATKKATPSKKEVEKIVKKTDKTVDFKAMDAKQLTKFITEKRADMITLKQSHKAGELVNPRAITVNRKEVARALTALSAVKKENK
jgi:ribosomal protein L29